MNILVIGGDSFIAGHYIGRLGGRHDLTIIAMGEVPFPGSITVNGYDNIDDALFDGKDTVINFAALVHRAERIPEHEYDSANHLLPVDLARRARAAGAGHFIQMSTIAVYGATDRININTPEEPDTPYGRSKLAADNDLLGLQDDAYGILVIRPSMVYGGGRAPGNMMRMIGLAGRGLPLPFGGTVNSRQFLNVHTLVDFLERGTENRIRGKYILADSEGVSTGDLTDIIGIHMNRPVRQFRVPAPFIRMLKKVRPSLFEKLYGSLHIDCDDTYETFGMRPTHGIVDGIEEMIRAMNIQR